MPAQCIIVARKELMDHLRDVRSLISAGLYALMGPFVVLIVARAVRGANQPMLAGMMSVFTLVSAFVGGMYVAMDMTAGERERRSLLPLLMNPITRLDLMIGKWLATSVFAVAGLLTTL